MKLQPSSADMYATVRELLTDDDDGAVRVVLSQGSWEKEGGGGREKLD